MDKLFELSATLTLDTAAFLQGLAQAERAARTAAATLTQLQNTTVSSWGRIAAAIQAATARLQEFLALQGSSAPSTPGYATGLSYVPYNDFPARLHEGEAVLTRLEAQQWRSRDAANQIDPSALAQTLAGALSGLTVQLDGQTVGQLVAPAVSREIARQANARRYST